jgi:hypothetical protein
METSFHFPDVAYALLRNGIIAVCAAAARAGVAQCGCRGLIRSVRLQQPHRRSTVREFDENQ